MNRFSWLVLFSFLPLILCHAQTTVGSAASKSPSELKMLLSDAYNQNALETLQPPYHIVASFQIFSADGQPAGEGTIERFFPAQGRMKTVTKYHNHTMTEYLLGSKRLYTDDGYEGSIMTYRIDDFLFNAVPPPRGMDRRELDYKPMQLQGVAMDCAMYQFFMTPSSLPAPPKEVLCVSSDTHDIALKQTQHLSVRYKDFVAFRTKSIPRNISIIEGPQVRGRVHIEQLDEAIPDDSAMIPSPDASSVSPGPIWTATSEQEDHRVKGVDPASKGSGFKSYVSMMVLAARSGAVMDIEPLFGPNPTVMQTAVDAVRGWAYAPLVRAGKPVEVIRTVFVRF